MSFGVASATNCVTFAFSASNSSRLTGSEQLTMNGVAVWAYVVELVGGLRVRLDLTDWERLNLYRGQRVPVRLYGRVNEWLFLAETVELPPVAWVVFAKRLRAAG